ncbi:MAG: IPT/TIG domain-containing protein [Chlamydiota bacterium]
MTVDGDSQQDTSIAPIYGNSDRFFAIGYHNANGTVQNVHTTNTRQTMNFNELAGGGIINASNTGTVTFNVTNCLVDFYQRLGIDCRGSALTANISNSTVNRGYVLTPNTSTATPNGIQFSGSATGTIANNIVSNNIATVVGAASSGIIPFGAGPNLIISGNTIENNDVGIAAIQNGNNLTIQNNSILFTTTPGVNPDEGILIQDTNGLTIITSNTMHNIPDVNMELDSSTDQPFQLSDNTFIGSQVGLLVNGNTTAGPIVTMHNDAFIATIGYYIEEFNAPNPMWPSTATVSFDGLRSGHITMFEYNQIQAKLFGKLQDGALGLILDYITPIPPLLFNVNPTSGPSTGGNTVTIMGTSFISSNTQVFFGSTPATNIVIVSDMELTVTAPPGTGTVDVTVMTPFGTTPIVSPDQYTYVMVAPLPPSNFIGVVKKNKFLNETQYILKSHWDASPSPDVVLYRIYKGKNVIDEIFVGSPLVFKTCLNSEEAATKYKVAAVNSHGLESNLVSIRIVND